MNLQKGDYFCLITWITQKQYELLPFGAFYNLIAKMHTITTSKFW